MVRDANYRFHHFEDGVFHAWTIGDAGSCLFNQCLHQFYLVCSMSSGIITPPS
jgi:hypothetical protein